MRVATAFTPPIRITPEVSADELEEMAADAGVYIEFPGNRAGWARLKLPDGRRFKAWLNAPGAEA
jgi:hypothetical protein